jgi:hypothetical protein
MTSVAEPRPHARMHRYDDELVAQVCYDALRRFRILTGDGPAPPPWHKLASERRENAREAVRLARTGVLPETAGTLTDRDASQLTYQIVVALTAVAS